MSIKARLANRLRGLAQLIDGREVMSSKWHTYSVNQMNKYIERTDREIERLKEQDGKS